MVRCIQQLLPAMRMLRAPILGSLAYQVVLPSLYQPLKLASKSSKKMRCGGPESVGVLVGT